MVDRPYLAGLEILRLITFQPVDLVIFEDVISQLVGGIELASVDRPKRRQFGHQRGFLARQIVVGDIVAELVGIAHVAAEQGEQGIALELRLVAVLEQLEQGVMGTCHRRGRLGGGRRLGDWRRGDRG